MIDWPFRDKEDLYAKERQAICLLLEERRTVNMSKEQPIIVGSVVHYMVANTCRAAIVTARKSDTISVCILNPTGIFFDTSVAEDWLVKTSNTWHRLDGC